MPSTAATSPLLLVGLGESLFDCFPDRAIMGGAPLNLAVHAHQLLAPAGGHAVVATRVGNDELGKQIIDELTRRQMDVSHVQVDPKHPTGTVQVAVDSDGHPSYVFTPDVAWDHLEWSPAWQELARSCHAVCYGTLAQRCEVSRRTIEQFLERAPQALRLFDVNLRQNFYSVEVIDRSLHLATAVKLNDSELPEVSTLLGLPVAADDTDAQAEQIIARYGLAWLALTRGPRGTLVYAEGAQYFGDPVTFPRAEGADTVGAGDACGAALAVGHVHGWPMQKTVDLANRLGAYLASQPGATPQLPPELIG